MRRLSLHRASLAATAIVIVAGLFRVWLIADHHMAFVSDEAIVALMARHINAGKPIPTFFYGQHHLGSLDALLVAGSFRLFGETVPSLRISQIPLFLLILATAYWLALDVTHSRRVAWITLLLVAISSPLGTLYTGVGYGGYTELTLFSELVLLFGWQVTLGARQDLWRWAALGLAAGLGWWTTGAIVTPCLVVGLLGLRTFSRRKWRAYAIAVVGFLIGSAPWWIYNLRHDWIALNFLLSGYQSVPGTAPVSHGEALLALLVLGVPTLYGLRYPWQAGLAASSAVVVGGLVYLLLITDWLADRYARMKSRNAPPDNSTGTIRPAAALTAPQWVVLILGVFAVVFASSSFSDATGRYLMPVWIPATIGVAHGLDRLRRAGWMVAAVALAALLVAQAGLVIRAARTETGLTQQLVQRLRAPAQDDAALLDFLARKDYHYGYASYWTSFSIIFLAHESVILDSALPYDEHGYRSNDNRYPPYRDMVAAAPRVVWITQNFPDLDALIAQRLAAVDVSYRAQDIGVYRVYYAFSLRISPADLGLESPRPLDELIADKAAPPLFLDDKFAPACDACGDSP